MLGGDQECGSSAPPPKNFLKSFSILSTTDVNTA